VDLADDFHVYAIEWQTNAIRWYIDDIEYFAATPGSLGGKTWVFQHPFFLNLNLAVGGNWPDNPGSSDCACRRLRSARHRVALSALHSSLPEVRLGRIDEGS
jgi:beta-glucanase (GH16 family)